MDGAVRQQKRCGGPLAYEVMGRMRVYRTEKGRRRYKFQCQDCRRTGENDGRARMCVGPQKVEEEHEDMLQIKPGDVLRARNLKVVSPDANLEVSFTPDQARKREEQNVFVFLLLGTEPKVGKHLDAEKVLEDMGWKQAPAQMTVTPEFERCAALTRKAIDNGVMPVNEPRMKVHLTAKDIGCNGVQFRSLGAKKYRSYLREALRHVGVCLVEVKMTKEKGTSTLVLDVIDFK